MQLAERVLSDTGRLQQEAVERWLSPWGWVSIACRLKS